MWELINGGSIGVVSGRTYIFSYWIRSISASNDASNSAIIKVYTNGTTSTPVLFSGSQVCPIGSPSAWVQVSYTWTATTSNAQIWLTDEQTNGGGAGNDFALDDITLKEDNGPLDLRYCFNGPSCPGNSNAVIAAWGRGGVPPYYFSLNNLPFQLLSAFPLSAPTSGNGLRIIDSKTPIPDTVSSLPLLIDIPETSDTLILSNDTSICASVPVYLAVSGGTNYSWTANTAANVANLGATTGASVTATPTATTTYTVTADKPGINLITNPGFEKGDSGFYSDYKYFVSTTNQQAYGITTNAQLFDASFSPCTAHNSPGTGKMMVIDGATSVRQVWSQVIAVTPNTNYVFSFYMQTLALPVPAQLNVSINGQVLGVAVASSTACGWSYYTYNWNSTISTLAYIDLFNQTTASNGNDFALDDLLFTTICTGVSKSVTITVGNLGAPSIDITQPDCSIPTGLVTVINPSTGVTYSFDNGLNFQASSTSPPLAANAVYQVMVKDGSGCTSAPTTANINPAPTVPAAPTVTNIQQPDCIVLGGGFTITSPIGLNIGYSADGPFYQAGTVFTGLVSYGYLVTAKDTVTGCISDPASVVINNPPLPPSPEPTLYVNPTCSSPTGSFTIFAPLGANYSYSIDGTNYQTNTLFSGLAPGDFFITVKDNNTGCVSLSTPGGFPPLPNPPAAPAVNAPTQPTCTIPTGSFTVAAPLDINYFYSIDGFNYQPGISFSNLSPGNYTVTVKDTSTGCISLPATVTINSTTGLPPSAVVGQTIHPTCTNARGSFTITSPTGANYTYSIDGINYQAAVVFSNLAPAIYPVTVKNINTGCISNVTGAPINPITGIPAAPAFSSTVQPTCTVPAGAVTIASPIGTNYQYSKDGVNFQSSILFNGLAPAAYSITVKNTGNGCVSAGTMVIINSAPTVPPAPQFSTPVHTTCISATGSFNIISPVGINYFYSINGTNYQPGTSFSGLLPALYSVFVKDTSTDCISLPAVVTINPVPFAPRAPVYTIVLNPNCANSTVSVSVTYPLGPAYTYSIDRINYQVNTLFDSLPPGLYYFTVKDINTGCVSDSTGLSSSGGINTSPPLVSDTIRYCQGVLATPLTATGQNLQWYDIPTGGTPLPAAPLPPTIFSDTTTYYVTQTLFGCESSRAVSVVIVSAVPALPIVTSPVVYCRGDNAASLSPSGTNYFWYTTATGGTGTSLETPSTVSPGTVNYYLSESINGCEGPRAEVAVQVNAAPVLGADKISNICKGEVVNLTTEYNTSGFTAAYLLNNTPVVNPLAVAENGEYLITASAGNGCDDSAVILVTVRPRLTVFAGNDFTTVAGQPVQLTANAAGGFGALYTWSVIQPSAGVLLSNGSAENPVAIFSEGSSTLQIMIMDDIGCTGYDSITVTATASGEIVAVPNAFSPNNDPLALNETFRPIPGGISSIRYFRVFNRYGELVFETNQLSKGWDGNYKGMPQHAGAYTWVLSCISVTGTQINKKGTVVLVR